ncbi:MAG: DEAD/DEAH box helicase [bacterium]
MLFEELGLRTELLRAVTVNGYTEPTPIQIKTIPSILNGRDIMGGAQTGTGKTAAFALPILQLLAARNNKRQSPRALVLTPTRELAEQVFQSMRTYGREMPLRSAVIYGGVNIRPQIIRFRQGVDILVATPGRLLDHLNQRTLDLSHIQILVLDEADRMLDMGFIPDIKKIIHKLPRKRQSLLFSATLSNDIMHLADGLLTDPKLIQVDPGNTAADCVSQVVHPVMRARKSRLLNYLIHNGKWRRVLVFTRTKRGADRLTGQLKREKVRAAAIHGDKTQAVRTRVLSDFKKGFIHVLVATDIAARGLDISGLPYVVNYDLPEVPIDYIHRIGRTGRAGLNGIALSLVCEEEWGRLTDIEMALNYKVKVEEIKGFSAPFLNNINQAECTAVPTGMPVAEGSRYRKYLSGNRRLKRPRRRV